MSKKLWFVFEENHHIGPFTTIEVIQKIESGELGEEDQLWYEGLPAWQVVKSFNEFTHLFLPPLPPLPFEAMDEEFPLPPMPPVEEIEESEIEDDLPPPLPPLPEVEQAEELEESDLATDGEEESDLTSPAHIIPTESDLEKRRPSQLLIAASVIVSFFIILVTLYFYRQGLGASPEFYELRANDTELMKSLVKEPKLLTEFEKSTPPFLLRLSRDGRFLVGATALKGNYHAQISLVSVDGEVLSQKTIMMQSEGILTNHKVSFGELVLVQGTGFVSGRYDYKISLTPALMDARLFRVLERFPWLKGFIETQPTKNAIEIQGRELFSKSSEEDFLKELAQFSQQINLERIKPMQDRVEVYRTFGMLMTRLGEVYKEVLNTVRRPEHVDRLEMKYGEEIGPLLQSLILENYQLGQDTRLKGDLEEAETYDRLVDFGKQIGALVSDMVTTTKSSRSFNLAARERLLKLFEDRLANLQKDLQNRLAFLEKEIEIQGAASSSR